jgi:RHS repeat-associated protein
MRKRFISKLAIALSFTLGSSPGLSLAASPERVEWSAERHAGTKSVPAPSRAKPASRRGKQAPAELEGRTVTPLADGRLLQVGGRGADGPQAVASVIDPRTGKTLLLANGLHEPRAFHTATALPDGRVLVFGGLGRGDRPTASAEVFDPASQTFELLSKPGLTARAYHTATLLTDGRVLIVGGASDEGRAPGRAELWDSRTRAATPLQATPSVARRGHKATLLPDGNVLLEGGADGEAREAEVFDAEARSFNPSALSSETVDDNPPFLAASLPASGASDVPVEGGIALRFSKPLRVETVNSATVKLSGPEGLVAARVVAAENGRLAFVTPSGSLLRGSTYTVLLDGASGGSAALVPTVVTFRTEGEAEEDEQQGNGRANNNHPDVDWSPGADNFRGNWKTNQPKSKWQSLAPLQAEPGVTAVAGQALTLLGQPLANVTLRIADRTARTDDSGRFLLTSVPHGRRALHIDGRTANRPGRVYGLFKGGVEVEEGRTNVLPFTIWMPRLDMTNATTIASPTRGEVVVTHPQMPGLELRLPAGTVIRDTDGRTVTQISITPVPTDRSPFPLPPGYDVPVFFTIQPGGARLIPPRARLIYPNYTGERPGARINFWNNDPEEKGWYVYGQGTVSPDGRQIIPDPGVVIYEFSGIMISGTGNPPPNGPGAGCGPDGTDGDPVDLGTGLFVLDKTDLALPDTIPLILRRTYRPGDSNTRAFGIGASHPYEMFLWSNNNYQEADLILPDGGRIHYVRTSPGTGYTTAVYEHTATPSVFYKSQLRWTSEGFGFELVLKDGTIYFFPDMGRLQYIRDRYGNKVTVTRAGGTTGNITQLTSPNGRWMRFTYDGSNRVTQAKDNIGRTVNYEYDTGGRLWKVTNPAGGVTEYTYDSSNRMLTVKDARGIVYLTNEYNSAGRVTKQTQADNTTYQFAYTLNGSGKVTQTDVTDPRGNVRRVTFNANGYILTDKRAVGDAKERTTVYERQSGSNLITSVTAPPLDVSDPGRETTYAYDTMGNVTDVTRLEGTSNAATTQFTFEPTFNQVATVTDPLNRTTTYGYDARGALTSITDPLNHQTTLTYNAEGQPLTVTDPLNNTTTFSYELGNLVSITDPLGRQINRFVDSVGRLLSVSNALGQSARLEYDSLNQLVKLTDPRGAVTTFTYDANGNLLSLTDARSNVTAYAYNSMDRLETRTDALLGVEGFEYDAAGNRTKFTDTRGVVTRYTYDKLNRNTFIGYGETTGPVYESTVNYAFDPGDRLTSVVHSSAGTITREFDGLDRLTSETTPQGEVNYSYDAASRRTQMTVVGQTAVDYTYDNADRLTEVEQGTSAVTLAYDAADRRTSLTLPNGVSVEYGYDAASQLTALTYKNGATTLGDLSYGYDHAGRRTQVGGTFARTGLPQAVGSATYNASNQLTQWGTASLTYDASGNMLGDGVNTYSWNARHQLQSISGTGLTASFQYDGLGRRVGKTVNGQSTAYLYDGENVVQELSGGSPTANLLTGLDVDEVFARTDSAGARTFLPDGLGSTLALLDSTGTTQTQYTYEPFGKTTASGATTANTFQFTGRENDGTGLYNYRARYYSPSLHRFISVDPIGFRGGDQNLYSYTYGSPTNFTDPSGNQVAEATWGGAAAGAVVGGPPGAVVGAIVGAAVGLVAGYLLWEYVVNPHLVQPYYEARSGKERIGDSGLENVSDEEISRLARDRSLPGPDRRRYQKEEKWRKQRNKEKRQKDPNKKGGTPPVPMPGDPSDDPPAPGAPGSPYPGSPACRKC